MIFQFSDSATFLIHYVKALPKGGHGEARKIALHLNVSSTFVSHVLSGQKKLTPEQAELLAEYLGLNALESDYFFYLIQKERAGTQRLKSFCQKKLDNLREESFKLINRAPPKKSLTEQEMSVFYSHPIYSAIHLYTSTARDGRTSEEIAQRFQLKKSKVTELTTFLLDVGLIEESTNRFRMTTQSTYLERKSPHLYKHLSNWRLKAIEASDSVSETEVMYTANVSISQEDFEKLREKMILFIDAFLKEVHASPAEDVACFNMDFFWLRK